MKTLLAIVVLSLSLSGCAPCSDSCSQQAAIYERCLADWGLEWTDLGATDRDDFRYDCSDANLMWLSSMDSDSAAAQKGHCSSLANSLRNETDCAQAWEALVSYGAAP